MAVGADVVSVSRIQEALDRSGDRFTQRFFSKKEQSYCDVQSHRAWHYAARWAAKEAVFKSIPGYPGVTIPWRDVCLDTSNANGPSLSISKSHRSRVGLDFQISLSHRDDSVMAFVLAKRFERKDD